MRKCVLCAISLMCVAPLVGGAVLLFLPGCAPRDMAAEAAVNERRQQIVCRALVELLATAKVEKVEPKVESRPLDRLATPDPMGPVLADVMANDALARDLEAHKDAIRAVAWTLGVWLAGVLLIWAHVFRAWWNDGWTPVMRYVEGNNEETYRKCFLIAGFWPLYAAIGAFTVPHRLVCGLRERNLERRRRIAEARARPIEDLEREVDEMMRREGID